MELVDRAFLETLPQRRAPAADPDVAVARGLARAVERFADAAGHEMKRRAALHAQRRTRVVREDEYGHVIRRRVAPPASPRLVRPRSANRPEHVPAEDVGAGIFEALRREPLIDA